MKLQDMIKAKQNKVSELNETIKNENSTIEEVRSAVNELEVVSVELNDLQETLAEVEARNAKPEGVANVLGATSDDNVTDDEFNTMEYRTAFKNYVMTGTVDEVLTRANAKTKKADVAFKEYPKEGPVFFGSFKTYGGTNLKGSQKTAAEVMTIIDTANIECFYRPDIKAECRIKNLINNNVYDIINEPEDIEQRRVMLKFKVQRLKGGL